MRFLKRLWQTAPGWRAWLETVAITLLFMALLYDLRQELTAHLVGQGERVRDGQPVAWLRPFA